jgi:hypothetical protein
VGDLGCALTCGTLAQSWCLYHEPRSKFRTLELGPNSHGRLMGYGLYHDNDKDPIIIVV